MSHEGASAHGDCCFTAGLTETRGVWIFYFVVWTREDVPVCTVVSAEHQQTGTRHPANIISESLIWRRKAFEWLHQYLALNELIRSCQYIFSCWKTTEECLENILRGEVTPHHVSVPFCVSIKMTKSKAIEGGGLGFILWGQFLILTCSFRCCRGAPGSSVHIVLIMGLILKGFSGEDSNNHQLGWVKWFSGGWGFKMHVCDQRAVTLNPPQIVNENTVCVGKVNEHLSSVPWPAHFKTLNPWLLPRTPIKDWSPERAGQLSLL